MDTARIISEEATLEKKYNGPIRYIEVKKSENKKIKIPCSNEVTANKVIAGLKRLKTASTITLLY